MRSVAGFAAACIAVASMVCNSCAIAEATADGAALDHVLLFSGTDLWRNGGFMHGGLLWSPRGLTNEGFTLKLLMAGGAYRYRSGAAEITGGMGLAALMPGWRVMTGGLEVLVYAGPELQFHRLWPDDPGNRLRRSHGGARAGIDIWTEPSDRTMLALSFSGSTIGPNYWTRVAFGWRVLDAAWIGPETGALGDMTYRQFRLGAHVTGLRTKVLEWSAGAGYAADSDRRDGIYGHLGFVMRR